MRRLIYCFVLAISVINLNAAPAQANSCPEGYHWVAPEVVADEQAVTGAIGATGHCAPNDPKAGGGGGETGGGSAGATEHCTADVASPEPTSNDNGVLACPDFATMQTIDVSAVARSARTRTR